MVPNVGFEEAGESDTRAHWTGSGPKCCEFDNRRSVKELYNDRSQIVIDSSTFHKLLKSHFPEDGHSHDDLKEGQSSTQPQWRRCLQHQPFHISLTKHLSLSFKLFLLFQL
jgi:hypothetical protein